MWTFISLAYNSQMVKRSLLFFNEHEQQEQFYLFSLTTFCPLNLQRQWKWPTINECQLYLVAVFKGKKLTWPCETFFFLKYLYKVYRFKLKMGYKYWSNQPIRAFEIYKVQNHFNFLGHRVNYTFNVLIHQYSF